MATLQPTSSGHHAMVMSPSVTSGSGSTGVGLPQMRIHPLMPGSQKEIAFIEHVDSRILQISRRYAKKFVTEDDAESDARGYNDFDQCARDLEGVFNIVWISGTPSLQIPYLLSLAGLLCSYLPAFPFAPTPTFRIARKFDAAFVFLLHGASVADFLDEQSKLYEVSTTDKVRIKSLVSATRVTAFEVAESSGYSPYVDDTADEDDADEDDEPQESPEEGKLDCSHDQVSISLSRMYQRTLEILGDNLN